jgi:hypothetical protein
MCYLKRILYEPSKGSFLFSDGLGPYFVEQMVHDLIKSNNVYHVHYDEITTSQNIKQMDILIRYWSEEKDQVVVRFLKSLAFGHSKAAQVAPLILSTLQEHNSLLK